MGSSSDQVAVKKVAVVKNSSVTEWERNRWGIWDQVRFMLMIVLWVAAWIARALLVFLPQHSSGVLGLIDQVSKSNLFPADEDSKSSSASRGGVWSAQAGGLAKCAIGRALSQVLDLVNEIPASSRKYEFARSLADKIIYDNLEHGGQVLRDVNRLALETSFSRTVYLLGHSLEGIHRQQQVEAWGWAWRMIKGVPLGAASLSCQFVPLLGTLRNRLGSVFQSQSMQQLMMVSEGGEGGEMTEKLAQELLWISQRLKENAALEVAIMQWGSASSLASQSVSANPRVQKLLVKLSAFLCSGLLASEVEPPSDVTLKLLLLWLPLFCRSTHGVDGTIFTSAEKHETERVLERTIKLLPDVEQELVLALWLNEYVYSTSDWPNLQGCYDGWCYSTRKLNYAPGEDDDEAEMLENNGGARLELLEDNETSSKKAD